MDEDASVAVARNVMQPGNSELSGNESTIYLGRTSVVARSGKLEPHTTETTVTHRYISAFGPRVTNLSFALHASFISK